MALHQKVNILRACGILLAASLATCVFSSETPVNKMQEKIDEQMNILKGLKSYRSDFRVVVDGGRTTEYRYRTDGAKWRLETLRKEQQDNDLKPTSVSAYDGVMLYELDLASSSLVIVPGTEARFMAAPIPPLLYAIRGMRFALGDDIALRRPLTASDLGAGHVPSDIHSRLVDVQSTAIARDAVGVHSVGFVAEKTNGLLLVNAYRAEPLNILGPCEYVVVHKNGKLTSIPIVPAQEFMELKGPTGTVWRYPKEYSMKLPEPNEQGGLTWRQNTFIQLKADFDMEIDDEMFVIDRSLAKRIVE